MEDLPIYDPNGLPKNDFKSSRHISKSYDCLGGIEEPLLPYALDDLTPSMKYELKYKLKETEETRAKGLKTMRELLQKEQKLHFRDEDEFLVQFLRARKYDVKKAFQVMKNFYKFRKDNPSIFITDENTPTKFKDIVLKNFSGFLTYRDRKGSVVMIFKFGSWNADEVSVDENALIIAGYLCHAIEYSATQVTGFRVIIDFRDITWKHVKLCTPKTLLLLIRSTQQCFPARYRGIHILCDNPLFSLAWSIVHPFLTNKLRKRVRFHGKNMDGLQQFIDPSILPEEFGGLARPFDNASWDKIIDRDCEMIMSCLQYGYK